MVHIVYCDSLEIDKILEGTKTMVMRASDGRKVPHSRVFIDEKLYFMDKKTKQLVATAEVLDVQNYVKLNNEDMNEIIEKNNDKLLLTETEKQKWHKRCMCLVEFHNVQKLSPIKFQIDNTLNNWLICENIEEKCMAQ